MVQVLCIPPQYVLCVLPYSTLCIYCQLVASWCSSNDNVCWVLDLWLLLLHFPFLPLGLSYKNTPGIFLYLLMVFQGPSRIVLAVICSGVFLFSISLLDISWFFIFWAVVSCFLYFLFYWISFFLQRVYASPSIIRLH